MRKWVAEIANHKTNIHLETLYADTEAQAIEELTAAGWTVWSIQVLPPTDPALLATIDSIRKNQDAQLKMIRDASERFQPERFYKTVRNAVLVAMIAFGVLMWMVFGVVKGIGGVIENEMARQRQSARE